MKPFLPSIVAILALVAIVVATERLISGRSGVIAEDVSIGDTPATLFRPIDASAEADPPPVILIAHGFAGSRRLMAPFARTLAKNGYIAATFDFVGHGEHPRPMTGDVDSVDGPTKAMVAQMAEVAAFALSRTRGSDLATVGHSMASDIVVRFAEEEPMVDATVGISVFSPAITSTAPKNLLIIVGDWEGMLKREALRVVGLTAAPHTAVEGRTYGTFSDGTARRVVFARNSEHIAVLFDPESFIAAVRWLDQAFLIERGAPIEAKTTLPWISLLVLGIVALGFPVTHTLPMLSEPPSGAALSWARLWPVVVIPALVVPLSLRLIPTDFLPIIVGDYLAAHFFTYGLVTFVVVVWVQRLYRPGRRIWPLPFPATKAAIATLIVTLYGTCALGIAIHATITNYYPVSVRYPLFIILLLGTLFYFFTNEWALRGPGVGFGAMVAGKLAFVLSLAIAVALDFERLFFLIIIVPIIVIFFVIYGLLSRWCYIRTGHPMPGAIASAVAFAWGIAVTFPLFSG
ncbi:MAG: alpha/beta fold hydrolase [Pseudomonadota bacterium]